jgi:hypothetical protein
MLGPKFQILVLAFLTSKTNSFSLNIFSPFSTEDKLDDFSDFFVKKTHEAEEKLTFLSKEETTKDELIVPIVPTPYDYQDEIVKHDYNPNPIMDEISDPNTKAAYRSVKVTKKCSIENPAVGVSKPIYETRPDKFLIPLIAWGPNNQLRGFREAAILAVKLNRTLCIPPFFKHHSDLTLQTKNGISYLPAEVRLDLESVRHLVSTCETSEIAKKCKSKIDAVYMAREICSGHIKNRIESFRNASGIEPFLDEQCKPNNGISTYPNPLYSKNINNLPFDSARLLELYPDNNAQCAVWLFPYIQFQVTLTLTLTLYLHLISGI